MTDHTPMDSGDSSRPDLADTGDRTDTTQESRAGDGSRGLRWGIAGFLALLAVIAIVALVVEVTSLRPKSEQLDADREARSDVVRAAERFAVQVNNYDVASVDKYQATITPLLSPKFKGEFEKAMTDIVTSVKQAKMQAAWIPGIRPTGTTNTVRRIPSIRTRVPSPYSASSIAAWPAPVRAQAAR